MRPSLLPLLASACFGFGFVQPPRVGPAASRVAHRSFGRASVRLMGKDLNRDELFAMMMQQQRKPQGRPGRPGRPAQRGPSKPPARSEPASTQPEVAVGATLELPVPRMVEVSGVADGAPSASSLEQLAGGRGKLVLLVSGESAMSERYRQTLLALREVAWSELGAQVASISRVPPKSYRKLARKEGLELPLLSDAGAEWLGALGAGAASAPLTALVLGLPAATVLGSFRAEEGESAAALVERVAAAVPSAEAAAAAAIEAAAAASAAATLAAENEAMRRQLAELRAQEAEAEAAAAVVAARAAAAAALEEQNAAAAAARAAREAAKESAAAEKEARKRQKVEKARRKQQEVKAAREAAATAAAQAAPPPIGAPAPPPSPPSALPAKRAAKRAAKQAAAAAGAAAAPVTAEAATPAAPPKRPAAAAAAAAAEEEEYDVSRIRNFCIIAHIDHGKSTLADRLLQSTGAVAEREMKAQLLDNMELERERGITIKLQAARLKYKARDGLTYVLNLIDTPGHVDFQYEVSRSLAACEGALLVVDASQGVEAQTIANVQLALGNELRVLPVLNKIDLPGADVDATAQEIESTLELDCTEAIPCSAKLGTGVGAILEAIVAQVPPPADRAASPLRALIFDSYYDPFRGVIVFVRVVDGVMRRGDTVHFAASGMEYEVLEVGTLSPGGQQPKGALRAGEVGYMHGAIKQVTHARVGDTICSGDAKARAAIAPLPGYAEPLPVVYCGLFPVDSTQYQLLRESLERLCLNDAALQFEPESSSAMGFGFRCGFLGLLHMEVVQQRLEREFDLDLLVTAPSVVYKVTGLDGSVVEVDSPAKMPDAERRRSVAEPYADLEMFAPKEYSGALMDLAQSRRGEYVDLKFLNERRCSIRYSIPLAELITDFFDAMKSRSKGYASMEYSVSGYRENDLCRLDILIAGEPALPLAAIVHREEAHGVGKLLTRKLKELIPRQQFKVMVQAAVGQKIVASSAISPIRKDVLAKCYGGDISRKKKLLNKQAKGKKRMKAFGKVNVPQSAFLAVLNLKGD